MTTIQLSIEEEKLQQLELKAEEQGITVDALLQKTISSLLETAEERKKRLMREVVDQNLELYKRLA
ncbi:hypothetical protein [Siphonobacter aquaeclarae]|jgi:hypothetical protein|uniref:Ribbon-helix-helix protein, copG family n=1 Tax=Siphonobacter aquaeclarae TaxID=563176 RepID=A0A1G9PJQ1_9BACT|nr:hypothetical protein [Siphonobacter aquaeclarae]SDL99038.1 hypothetical protein SAMN04488090_2210 [Siphonobacter aquaeclarae]